MIEVKPFRRHDLELIFAQGVQDSQARAVSQVPSAYASLARVAGVTLSVWSGQDLLLVGGLVRVSEKNGMLWSVLNKRAGPHMLAIHRALTRFLGAQPERRIEATVEEGFARGCRWLELLGFEFEGKMRCFGDFGETHLRYALVRP